MIIILYPLLLLLLIVVPVFYLRKQSETLDDHRHLEQHGEFTSNDSKIHHARRMSGQFKSSGDQVTSMPPLYSQLSSSDARVVFDSVWEARQKWYNIGLQLNLDVNDLDAIQIRNNANPDCCIKEMLVCWLRGGGATWGALIGALKHKTVGYSDLANGITAKFIGQATNDSKSITSQVIETNSSKPGFKCPRCNTCSFEQYLKGDCPYFKTTTDSKLSFPYLDMKNLTGNERMNLRVQLYKETKAIMTQFSNVVFQLRESFKHRNIDPQDVAATALGIATSDSSTMSLMESFDAKIQTGSVDVLMSHLLQNGYVSFFNYHIIQDLIDKYGTEKDKTEFSKYVTRFKTFCERSIFEVPTHIFETIPSDSEMLAFKVTDKMLKILQSNNSRNDGELSPTPLTPPVSQSISSDTLRLSLENTLSVQMKVAEALGLLDSVWKLVFVSANQGCIELTFSVPISTIDMLKPQLRSHSDGWIDKKVLTNLESTGIMVLCGPPGKPHASSVTVDRVTIQWTRPEFEGSCPLRYYSVLYQSTKDPTISWRILQSKCFVEKLEIKQLTQNRSPFIFKVQAITDVGAGIQGESSDPIDLVKTSDAKWSTNKLNKPGKPKALCVTSNSIHLEWTKPVLNTEDSIIFYSILYRSANDRPNHWTEQKVLGIREEAVVSQLSENTTYIFQIQAECKASIGTESDISDPIKTKLIIPSRPGKLQVTNKSVHEGSHQNLAQLLRIERAKGFPIIASLALTPLIPEDCEQGIAKYNVQIPQEMSVEYPERVLILVGATESGKSTLIDGIANYIMGVKWEDNFRYKLIVNEGKVCSQTQAVTAYSFPVFEELQLPYKLTVVDTPGFGDTKGIERDEQVTAQIKHFFSLSSSEGIDHVDGIGFVIQSQPTQTQMYIIDTILSVFGKDMVSNIFMIITFADDAYPPVMDSIKTHIRCADPPIPFNTDNFFKFDNSVLFTRLSHDGGVDKMHWEMGYTSFHDLFNYLGQMIPQTLKLTKSVLDDQKLLQTLIQGVQRHLYKGENSLNELHGKIKTWNDNEMRLRDSQNFTHEVIVPIQTQEQLQSTHAVVCLKCNQICLPIWTTQHGYLMSCPIIDSSGQCIVCPGQCHWTEHETQCKKKALPYTTYYETRTDPELEKKYRNAKQEKASLERMILEIRGKLEDTYQSVCICFDQVQHCLERLKKRALRPNPLTELDYVNILIEAEKQEKSLGWEKRVTFYEKARESAEVIYHAKKGKIPKHMNLEAIMKNLVKDIPI